MKKRLLILGISCILSIALFCAWHFHLFPFKNPYARIPVQFTSSQIPYTEVEIEGQKYLIEIDTGFNGCEFTLNKNVLEKINKQYTKESVWFDIKGNQYKSPRYIIPQIKMGKAKINTPSVNEENDEFLANAQLGDTERKFHVEISGRMGITPVLMVDMLFDFKNSVFFLVRNKEKLKSFKKEGYAIENLFEVPFEISSRSIIFTVETEAGKKRFLLDSGTSFSIIRPSFLSDEEQEETRQKRMFFTTSKFVIGDHDFGEMDLYLFDITDKVDNIDGILGMDFFLKHIIYLNAQERKALIGPSI